MRAIKFPIRFRAFDTGTSKNIGAIYNADNEAIASFVNKPNAEKIIKALKAARERNK